MASLCGGMALEKHLVGNLSIQDGLVQQPFERRGHVKDDVNSLKYHWNSKS